MIDKSEIMEFAREFGLAANVVEKDYVLGWVLAGIFNHPAISTQWVFKGGTCLKKCYFETYRFSEDLDFTISGSDGLDKEFLISCFNEISDWVYGETGIEIPQDLIRFEVYRNNQGGVSAQGRIAYRGPMQKRGDLPRIKLDLTLDELLVLEPVVRDVHHPYSDLPDEGIKILSYCFEEVFAEKIRALTERQRPRDLYDVVHLYRHDDLNPDQLLIFSTLSKKCDFKGIAVPSMDTFTKSPEREELEAEWKNMLAHQLPALPSFEQFWAVLPEVMDWLHGTKSKSVPGSIPMGRQAMDDTWRPSPMAQAWHTHVPMERIRFAAANRLCVNLRYQNSTRLIEPYSLRRTKDGNILLFAIKHESCENRSYRVDRIEGVEISNISYIPRFAVELTPSGPVSVPDRTVKPASGWTSRLTKSRSPRSRSYSGPTYVIKCSYCGKKFYRKKSGTRLNPHKDKNGYPCSGRTGFLVDTKY